MPDMRKDYYKKGKHLMPKCEAKRQEFPKSNFQKRIRICGRATESKCPKCNMVICSGCKPNHTESKCSNYAYKQVEV